MSHSRKSSWEHDERFRKTWDDLKQFFPKGESGNEELFSCLWDRDPNNKVKAKGQTGEYLKYTRHLTNNPYVVKQRVLESPDLIEKKVAIELMMWHTYLKGHERFLQFYGVFTGANHSWIVQDYCCRNLKDKLGDKPMKEPIVREVLKQVLEGIAFLHSKGLAHRTLQLSKILCVGKDSVPVKIYGLADGVINHDLIQLGDEGSSWKRVAATIGLMTPERILIDKNLTENGSTTVYFGPYTDMYTLGIITFQLLTGKTLYIEGCGQYNHKQFHDGCVDCAQLALNNMHERAHREKESYKRLDENCKKFIDGLLGWSNVDRMTADKAQIHSWLRSEQHGDRRAGRLVDVEEVGEANIEETDAEFERNQQARDTLLHSQSLLRIEPVQAETDRVGSGALYAIYPGSLDFIFLTNNDISYLTGRYAQLYRSSGHIGLTWLYDQLDTKCDDSFRQNLESTVNYWPQTGGKVCNRPLEEGLFHTHAVSDSQDCLGQYFWRCARMKCDPSPQRTTQRTTYSIPPIAYKVDIHTESDQRRRLLSNDSGPVSSPPRTQQSQFSTQHSTQHSTQRSTSGRRSDSSATQPRSVKQNVTNEDARRDDTQTVDRHEHSSRTSSHRQERQTRTVRNTEESLNMAFPEGHPDFDIDPYLQERTTTL